MSQQNPSAFNIGLAIFTMLSGAGNIIYPIKTGVLCGDLNTVGFLGFVVTGVLLPLLGLITMILFDGNYQNFFYRIGRVPGALAILFCMLILGPLLVMPRCITVSFDMLSVFFPSVSLPVFSIIFAGATFLLTYKQSSLFTMLSKYISPVLIGSLGLIIVLGLINAPAALPAERTWQAIFCEQLLHGFNTLDLIGSIFFAYAIVKLLNVSNDKNRMSKTAQIKSCVKGSFVAGALMTCFYYGFSFLGAHYAQLVNLEMNGAEIFRTIAYHIVGGHGIAILIVGVVIACISSLAALAAVFTDYLRNISNQSIGYLPALITGLTITAIVSNFGLSNILYYSESYILFGYPIIIVITICNLLYATCKIETIILPTAMMTLFMLYIQFIK